MRSTRLRKFRKKYQPLIICFKTLIILYMIIFSASYLTTDTVAYFHAKAESTFTITAAKPLGDKEAESGKVLEGPEDTSSLSFVEQEEIEDNTCPVQLEIEITNEDESLMLTEGIYEVLYVEKHSPKEDGEPLSLKEYEGAIELLQQGQIEERTYEANSSGFYQLVMYQDEETPEEDRVWGEVFEVVCEEENLNMEGENNEEKEHNEVDE